MKELIIILLAVAFIAGLCGFTVYIDNNITMTGVKTLRVVTDKGETIYFAPAPTPISPAQTPIPRARRWYGPAGPALAPEK